MNSISNNDRHVLIIEDDPAAREATSIYLQYCGFDVATAADAESAYSEVEQQMPNLLICDWQLGTGEDGVSIARRLQARFNLPVIFMTAHPLDELYEATDDLSVSRFLRKPLSLNELREAVEESL